MKIQLLVYSGETFVQGLQLRKPGKRMKSEKTWQEKIEDERYSFQINFHVIVVLGKWWTFSMWTLWSHLLGFQQEM